MEELEKILKQMANQPIQVLKEPEIYYIVSIKERYIYDLHLTTITKEFCGRIENQTSTSIYFRLNGSRCCPKTPRLYWKMVGGTKRYIVRENKSEDNLFTRLPNPDGTVDLYMNKKMFDKAVEPFCKKMEDK